MNDDDYVDSTVMSWPDDQQVTLRLKDRAETVLVGEFEVR